MINKTVEEIQDEKFQKWWSHHPWRIVCVNNEKVFHINMLLVFAAINNTKPKKLSCRKNN